MNSRGNIRNQIKSLLAELSSDDMSDLVPEMAQLFNKHAFEYWWTRHEIYRSFEKAGIHLSRDHFYSALPNTAEAAAHLAKGAPLKAAESLFDAKAFLREWEALRRFADELTDIPRDESDGFFWKNVFFPNLDAILYYCMIRQYRPSRVVEIGSGFSTHIANLAIRRNGEGRLVIIEPYPTLKLRELLVDGHQLYEQKIQNIPHEFFAGFKDGDFLFIDSSHVSKTGSDLNHILFEIIPRIDAQMFLHFHDIFLPYEYPASWVVDRGWAWNEQYMILTLLMDNARITPLVGSHLLERHCQDELGRDLKLLGHNSFTGGSLWLKSRGIAV
jgi:methyltransferase family protein